MSNWRERLVEGTRDAIERRTGYAVEKADHVRYLEESDTERRIVQRELDLLGYNVLNHAWGRPQELTPSERRKLAQKSRVVWMRDPQAGAAVDLMNDFVFGRGLTKPKANDPAVQEVIDEAWDDPDNQLVLTSYAAQLAQGTDLELQSNIFILIFEDGEDGKVKLGLLDHDTVETVVRDEDNRLRILYYLARHQSMKWDYKNDQPMQVTNLQNTTPTTGLANAPTRPDPGISKNTQLLNQGVVKYYEHWRNVEDIMAEADAGARTAPETPPAGKMGDGKVYHVAINKGMEMAFGHPRMDRLIRWYNAYNNFMDARVDIMAASAAFVMKRKVQGTPTQLVKQANQALSRRSSLAMSRDPMGADLGPKAAGILVENESVTHEDFNINTNAPAAAQDAQMIRSMISAATRWPQSYYGDASQSNLATATSLELPVLKAVESRQRVIEDLVRFFTDRVIERAVDQGRLSADLTDDEVAQKAQSKPAPEKQPRPTNLEPGDVAAVEAYQDEGQDEQDTDRDLGYEFSMPSPLVRMLTDVVTAVQLIATSFDPTSSNTEMKRTLLTVALQELGLEDPAGAVERIYPPGYVDPAVSAEAGPPSAPPAGGGGDETNNQFGEFQQPMPQDGGIGGDPNNGYGGGYGAGNPYGAVNGSQPPEKAMQEMRVQDQSADFRARVMKRAQDVDAMLDDSLDHVLGELSRNGNGNGSEH